MNDIVIPYVNPDLDGVACAIAVAALELSSWNARLMGDVDAETAVVLEHLQLLAPARVHDWSEVRSIWLVDTHHVRQLPAELPRERVTRITDHHPGGDSEAFPNAVIQNESVGAAATLIAEKYFERGGSIPLSINVLLQAAILSNTLGFRAGATADRDHRAFAKLSSFDPLPPSLIARMETARRGILGLGTTAIVERDYKLFETPRGLVLISQVEAPGALELLERDDLAAALRGIGTAKDAHASILNLVDTQANASAIVASSLELLGMLAGTLGSNVDSEGVLRVERLLQRKTDIVPHVIAGRQ